MNNRIVITIIVLLLVLVQAMGVIGAIVKGKKTLRQSFFGFLFVAMLAAMTYQMLTAGE